ncbi:unnamed protein product, partial [Ectocarpus fasciculatus]
ERDSNDAFSAPRDSKISFVQRLTLCEGALACHAIQGCLQRYICVCAEAIYRGDVSRKGELEEWLVAVLETTMFCLSGQ